MLPGTRGYRCRNSGEFTQAKEWYGKALQVGEKIGDHDLVADTCYALGITTQLQGDFVSADTWLVKALEIAELLGDESRRVSTARELGNLGQKGA